MMDSFNTGELRQSTTELRVEKSPVESTPSAGLLC